MKSINEGRLEEQLLLCGLLSLDVLKDLNAFTTSTKLPLLDILNEIIADTSKALKEEAEKSLKQILIDLESEEDLSATITIALFGTGSLDSVTQSYLKTKSIMLDGKTLFDSQQDHSESSLFDLTNDELLSYNPTPVQDIEKPNQHSELRYTKKESLGVGGMCFVDLLEDTQLGREVAFKYLKEGSNKVTAASFKLEARVMSQLNHPGILPVYDQLETGAVNGLTNNNDQHSIGYTMRVARHKSLDDRLEQGDIGIHEICDIVKQVALTLEHAHENLVIHRDVKPQNILLGEAGEVYLTDWGVCFLDIAHPDAYLMCSEFRYALVGSPPYMSPEQACCDIRALSLLSDIYSLGATLYYALTGHAPVQAETLNGYLKAIAHDKIKPAHELKPHETKYEVPIELSEICMQALNREPQKRQQSAREFAKQLDRFLKGEHERERRNYLFEQAMSKGDRESQRFYKIFEAQQICQRNIKEMKTSIKLNRNEVLKSQLWEEQEKLDQLINPLEESFSQSVLAYRTAYNQKSDDEKPRCALVKLFRSRYEDALRQGDQSWVAYFEERVREYSHSNELLDLDGSSSISLHGLMTETNVEVCLYEPKRYRTIDTLLFHLTGPVQHAIELKRGSYLLKIQHPESATVSFPLCIKGLSKLTIPISLPRKESIPKDFVYIYDNLAMQTLPVTVGKYFEFLNDIEPKEAKNYAPRFHHTHYARPNDDGKYIAPFTDPDGDTWQPDWPILLVSKEDATAYAEWLGKKLKRTVRLPTAEEWLKAAQGADERPYPWGMSFDPSLCSMRESIKGKPSPTKVGLYESDCSPYGICDVAGTITQWTSSLWPGTTTDYRVMGAAFNSMDVLCELSKEIRAPGNIGMLHTGFRVVLELEPQDFLSSGDEG